MIKSDKKIVVLIDAENAQFSVLEAVLLELKKHGHIIAKRAYGDWSSTHLRNWKQPLNELAISPVQQFSYTQGKNSSDAAMIIDAMDLLYTKKFDTFAIVSSDSDFTKLASRLKESEIYVFGVGEKKTPTSFRNACDNFIFTEVLRDIDSEEIQPASDQQSKPESENNSPEPFYGDSSLRGDTRLIRILINAVQEYADEDGWADLGLCGGLIKRQHPDFDSRTYGYPSLSKLVEATNLFDLDRRKTSGNKMTGVFIKGKRVN
ncbi:NYN domain-containing protein [Desulfopila sp. IMCC35008]|uniref:NYN domain-containing protein n=1 Tax=Desulfopila sp. IMCC35008 TaxID=2653858 RepID=UPI0013D703C1|nr:NYN domain-containing protein [Desulfopila sp. IMCC35008]